MNPTDADELMARVGSFAPISLADVEAVALLHTRFDRKYVLDRSLVADLLDEVAGRSTVLEIGGRRSFTYTSRYFDTDGLDSYRGAAFGRRGRFKVRTRTYEDHGTCALEVKTRGPRGTTVKVRLPHDPDAVHDLGTDGGAFVDAQLGVGGLHRRLHPTLTTTYRRTTLADPADGSRTTIDQDLRCRRGDDEHGLVGRLVVETKSTGAATALDRLLWERGERPVRISKFGVGMALHDPALPANRWNRVLRDHFDWRPRRHPIDVRRDARPVLAPGRPRHGLDVARADGEPAVGVAVQRGLLHAR